MENNLMIFEGNEIEILTKEDVNFEFNGECLFNGKQICKILQYSNDRDAISKHIRDKQKVKIKNSDVAKHDFRKLNNAGETFLTEKGVMKLIINSKMPKADEFEDLVWDIVSEVQSTGKYDSIEQQLKLIKDDKERELKLAIYQLDNVLKVSPNDLITALNKKNKELELNQYLQEKQLEDIRDAQKEQKEILETQQKRFDNIEVIGNRKQFTNEVNSVARKTGLSQQEIYTYTYKELEDQYGINLKTRCDNRKKEIQNKRLDEGKKVLSPSTLKSKVNNLIIADEEDLWRELGICLFNVRDKLLNK